MDVEKVEPIADVKPETEIKPKQNDDDGLKELNMDAYDDEDGIFYKFHYVFRHACLYSK